EIAQRLLLVGRGSLEHGAQHRLRIVRAGHRAPARILDAEGPLCPSADEADDEAQERPGPAIDERAVLSISTYALDDRPPLGVRALPRMRAEAQAEYLDRRCRIARAGRGRRRSVRLRELDHDALRLLGV